MKIKIGERDYELYFGMKFLSYVNKEKGIEVEGVNMGTGGMVKLELGANLLDPESLFTTLKAGLASESHQPSNKELENFIESKIADGTYQEFYKELWNEVKKAPVLSQAVRGKAKTAEMKLI